MVCQAIGSNLVGGGWQTRTIDGIFRSGGSRRVHEGIGSGRPIDLHQEFSAAARDSASSRSDRIGSDQNQERSACRQGHVAAQHGSWPTRGSAHEGATTRGASPRSQLGRNTWRGPSSAGSCVHAGIVCSRLTRVFCWKKGRQRTP